VNVVASAYGKNNDPKRFVEQSDLLYLDPNRNRTKSWMQSVGLQLPSDTNAFGSIGSITYQDGIVKIVGVPYKQYMRNGATSYTSDDGQASIDLENGKMHFATWGRTFFCTHAIDPK